MNERIKKLIIECYSPYANFEQEKFSELLLREAIDVIEQAPTQHCAYTTYYKSIIDCCKKLNIKPIKIERSDIKIIMTHHPTYKNKTNIVGKDIFYEKIKTQKIINDGSKNFCKALNSLTL